MLPLFFISKQKHLGKGPEIIPLLEAWLPVLRANLEAAQLGCPFLLVLLERLWTVPWGDPLPTGGCFNPILYPSAPIGATAPAVPQPQLCLLRAPPAETRAPARRPTSRPGLSPAPSPRRCPLPGLGAAPDCPAPGWVVGEALAAQPGPDRAP